MLKAVLEGQDCIVVVAVSGRVPVGFSRDRDILPTGTFTRFGGFDSRSRIETCRSELPPKR